MNNKGFTLIEVLTALIIISLALVIVSREIGKTLSITKNGSYEVMKKNIIKASELYTKDCNNNIISCNLNWENNQTTYKAKILKENGYYKDLLSPIDNKDLSDCLIIVTKKNNGVIESTIIDECY